MTAAATLLSGGAALAQDYADMSCDELWLARNQIYADEGYCFKTERALVEFGHRCYPPYGRLNRAEQRAVREIQYWEAQYGCD
ncbi:MAG TPA: YARHG domain-containing protein [Devosiaceae bacterium]|nr:YARHG domain-containing protein [Devosiaceae bacterium]